MPELINRIIEPHNTLSEERKLFSGTDLKNILVPLFIEQLLVMLVGIADTMMISYAGEAAVSGVSLVNQFNTIFIYVFSALASGGAVVVSQYLGSRNTAEGNRSAGQLVMISFVISAVLGLFSLLFCHQLLHLLFGKVEAEVMTACVTYLKISAYSFPAIALYNAGAAICRSMGNTRITMILSVTANIINVIGNAIGIFVLHAGVAGVAWPSLISRVFQAAAILWICFRKHEITLQVHHIFLFDREMVGKILHIAIPNGVENGVFQLVKVVLSSIVALFGTAQIAANGVAQSIWNMAALMTVAFSLAITTVAGRCMGAQDVEAAEYYIRKITRLTVFLAVLWNGLILLLCPLLLKAYRLSPEAARYTFWLVVIHNIFNGFMLPLSSIIGNGVRAAGDVKFAMRTTIATTLGVRMVLSYLLGVIFHLGVFGVAAAMCAEWTVKGILFVIRLERGRWKNFRVI